MLETMYPASANSRQTELADGIDDTQTSITVLDGSVLPSAPNLLALDPTNENAETILYTGKTGNILTGVTRGFEGTAQSWVAGTRVARFFTAYDHNTFKGNIEDLNERLGNIPAPQDASLIDKGIVQLSKSTKGDSDTLAATESAVGAVQQQVGNLANLQTTDKSNLVGAVNEVFTHVGDGKNLIKSAVIVKGGTVAGTSPHSFAELADGIGTIETSTVITGQKEVIGIYQMDIEKNMPIRTRVGLEKLPFNPAINYNGIEVQFSPDNKYMALCSTGVSMFKRIGDEYIPIPFPSIAENFRHGSFSPDSKFFALPSLAATSLRIFKIEDGDVFTEIKGFIIPSARSNFTTFSSDGKFLAVSLLEDPCIAIYSIEGEVFTKLPNPSVLPTNGGQGISFTPNADYLAISQGGTNLAIVYKRNGNTFTKLPNLPSFPGTNNGWGLSFSHSGEYLFIGASTTPGILMYKRNGDNFTRITSITQLQTQVLNISLSLDDTYMVLGLNDSPRLATYKLKGDITYKLADPSIPPTGIGYGVGISPDKQFLAVAHGTLPSCTMYDIRDKAIAASNDITLLTGNDSGLGYAKESGVAGEAKKIVKIWS